MALIESYRFNCRCTVIAGLFFLLALSLFTAECRAGIPDSGNESLNQDDSASSHFEDQEVERFEFGVVTDRSGLVQDWGMHPVVVIPNLSGIQYAWRIKLKYPSPVFVREEFSLPEPPATWKIRQQELRSAVSRGGDECVLEGFQLSDDGWIGHAWIISNGDPAGSYQIKVFVNGKEARTFRFNVSEALDPGLANRQW